MCDSAPSEEYQDYDDYDPNDIPPSQARPLTGIQYFTFTITQATFDIIGYSYPVPENPLTLPPPKTTSPPSGYSYPVPINPLGRFRLRNQS